VERARTGPRDEALPAHLPLRSWTDDAWAVRALAEPLALLDDHAHLEKKAAANALALLNRWPRSLAEAGTAGAGLRDGAEGWVRALAAVAKDEVEHLGLVLRVLARRGGRMSRGHANPYAAALHGLIRAGSGPGEVLDRLLVAALIEARSCERFAALLRAGPDADLRALYRGLEASERGHHRVFLDLARALPGAPDVAARWEWFLDQETRILAAQTPGPRMHSGVMEGACPRLLPPVSNAGNR
jgi:tRNA 2-(methylsulfanyl)-N6-isopentenyladenosine37 hydroxylase